MTCNYIVHTVARLGLVGIVGLVLSACGGGGSSTPSASTVSPISDGVTTSTYTVSTFASAAGTVINSIDATGSAAQFSAPRGIAVDSAGTLYVADSSNHTIRKITAAGVVTTLAGTAGSSGNKDGTGTAALFNEPFAVVVDGTGNLFVADTNNNAIRKVTAAGVVTTLAGGKGSGTSDGTGSAAKLHEPRGIAIDSAGTLYVADYENHMVRKVTQAGVVTTLAGGPDISGYVDAQGTAARFMALQGIAVDSAGNVYVTEEGNKDVRKITPSGLVTTMAGGVGKFSGPRGIAIDSGGNLYVGDYATNVVRKVTSAGTVTTYAGTSPVAGSVDGTSTNALFNGPSGIAIDSAGNLYVADTLNNTVRKISTSGTVTTLAGLAGRTSSVDGSGAAARFEDPYAIAADGSGNLYVADATDHSIRKITSAGVVTTLAGKGGSFGSADGTASNARFWAPLGIAADSAGNVYVADTGNATVRKITSVGVVTTLAGSAGQSGSADGTGAAARFISPYGITVDSAGTVYVVESNAVVRKITPTGVVTTLAGTSGTNGFTDGTGTAARFSVPFDIAVDGSGNLFVSDHGNHSVRKITPTGVVTTLAGSGSAGKTDATGTAASFKFPSGIAVDTVGNVYLADTDNQVIRKITPAGLVTTILGTGSVGSADGSGTVASFFNPKDVAVDASGKLYIVDRGNHTIRIARVAQ
jgi:sugar lactone lactonase YvrE